MPESLSTSRLKKRLLGAAMLIILAALLLPLFLGEPKPVTQEPAANNRNDFESKIQPLPPENALPELIVPDQNEVNSGLVLEKVDASSAAKTLLQKPETEQSSAITEQASAASKKDSTATPTVETIDQVVANSPESKPEQVPKSALETKVKLKPAPIPEPKAETVAKAPVVKEKAALSNKALDDATSGVDSIKKGWAVQAGIFSKEANAKSIASILKAKGMQPTISRAKTSFGEATRVWVGPFKSKSEAKAVSDKLKQKTGDGGYVAEYPFKS